MHNYLMMNNTTTIHDTNIRSQEELIQKKVKQTKIRPISEKYIDDIQQVKQHKDNKGILSTYHNFKYYNYNTKKRFQI